MDTGEGDDNIVDDWMYIDTSGRMMSGVDCKEEYREYRKQHSFYNDKLGGRLMFNTHDLDFSSDPFNHWVMDNFLDIKDAKGVKSSVY